MYSFVTLRLNYMSTKYNIYQHVSFHFPVSGQDYPITLLTALFNLNLTLKILYNSRIKEVAILLVLNVL